MKLRRRDFIKTTGLGLGGVMMVPNQMLAHKLSGASSQNEIIQLYEDLISTWVNGMMRCQIKHSSKGLNGALLSPASGRIHGRCYDAVYPFMYMAERTGVEAYLQAAIDVMDWSDNVYFPDGSYINDVNLSQWKGTTAFGAISLGEAVKFHGHVLPDKVKEKWMTRLEEIGNFLHGFMRKEISNINYPVTASYSLALIGDLVGNDKFKEKARELVQLFMEHLTENNLIYGEGKPYAKKSGKGLPPVDLGYNVEETLSGVVMYADLMKDEEVMHKALASMEAHLDFMLPDGAWDNSWGTRSYKWTYWGSLTTVGAHAALHILADKNPAFARAAYLNTQLMKRCTGKEGLLCGGPHYISHGVLPSIHHTFCHAKSLAHALNRRHLLEQQNTENLLPREKSEGIKTYAEIDTHLIAKDDWKATVTAYDWMFYGNKTHVRGGALSALWHQKVGPVFMASIIEYSHKLETVNMQWVKDPNAIELTPRLELRYGEDIFLSITDFNAKITSTSTKKAITVNAETSLVDADQNAPKGGKLPCSVTYVFEGEKMSVTVAKSDDKRLKDAVLYLPIISTNNESYKAENQKIIVEKSGGTLSLETNQQIEIGSTNETNRVFNYVPGMEAIPLMVRWQNLEEDIHVTIQIV